MAEDYFQLTEFMYELQNGPTTVDQFTSVVESLT